MTSPRCPRCGTDVGATWRWCLGCGYDPDGAQKRIRDEHLEHHLRKGSWVPVVVVLAGMVIGATILWRTAPEDQGAIRAAPTFVEPVEWRTFTPDDGSFRADFPSPPYADDAVALADGRPQLRWVTMVNQQYFAVVVTDTGDARLDEGMSDADAHAALQSFVDRSARSLGARVTSTDAARVNAAPALDYELVAEPTRTRGRVVLVGRQVFDVQVSGTATGSEEAERFVASFRLT